MLIGFKMNLLRVVLFFASAVLWAQAQDDEPLCSSTAPVHSTCDDDGADWVSGLTAVTISFSFVTLSWTPHPLNPPNIPESYEISWRRFKEATPLTEWRLSQRLNETVFNATSNTLSSTFDELQHNTPYEMRVCVSPAPNQSSDDPPPPKCGYCNLCFQTKNASIRLLKARSEISLDSEEITLTCEAASDPPSSIHWNAQINGTRVPLVESVPLEIDPDYSIHSQVMPPITISQLEYEPDDVDFLNPNCVIENGFDTLKVINPSFTASNASSIELLSSTIEFPSTGVIRFTCEAASDPPSSITWDARISGNTRENLDGGTNPKYTIDGRVDTAAMPPITVSYLEYSPNNVDFSNPDCLIRNGFDTLKVRNPFFTEVTSSPPTRGDISLTNARLELLTNGTNVYICEGTSSTLLEFTWDVRMSGPRVPLLSDNPNTLYVIVTNVDSTISPIVGSSRIYFDPNSVNFEDVECVIRNEMGSLLRVRTSEFIPVPIDVPNLVTLPVWAIILMLVLPLLVAIILVGVGVGYKCLYSKRKSRQIASSNIEKRGGINMANEYEASVALKAIPNSDPNSNILYTPLEKMLPSHMIVPSSDIRVSTVIGQGEFGVVYKGTHNKNNEQELVAVKTVKGIFATATDIQSFTEEILILQQFNHPNVMSLIGVCLGADKVGGGPSIILPFMSKGSLLNFLRKEADRLRPSKDADVTQIGAVEKSLVQICLQVARGMEYLAGQRFVHRDLAARNCMIDQHDQIKVGDFGLSEDIYAKNYFRQTSSGGVKLPVKWMALESLKLGVFSEKSDVWSYGVTCWEVFTCGEIPYPGIHPQQVMELLEQGQRLRKPGNPSCSNQMYSVLRLCWEVNPDNRQPFTELCSVMETQLHSMSDYLDLNVIANTHFNDITAAVENPYELADDSGDKEIPQSDSRAYDSVANDVHDSESVDMLYEPDDKTYFSM